MSSFPPRRARLAAPVFGLLILGGAVGAYAALDRVLTIYPVLAGSAVAGVYAVAVLFAGLVLLRALPARWRLASALAGCALIVGIRLADTNSRKPFLRDLSRAHEGMTIAEVDRLMAPYLRSPSAPGELTEPSTISFRHTREWWGDSDVGLIYFRDGLVATVRFLAD